MSRYIPRNRSTISMESEDIESELNDIPTEDIQAEASAPVENDDYEEETEVNADRIEEAFEVSAIDSTDAPEALTTACQVQYDVVKACVKSLTELEQTQTALESIAFEMQAIVAEHGRLDYQTAQLVKLSVESVCRQLPDDQRYFDFASMESFNSPIAGAATEVSLEGVLDRVKEISAKAAESMGKLISNSIALINSWTPIIDRYLTRAKAVQAKIDNSHREAGLKEITFKGASKLVVDGKNPEGKTVVSTTRVFNKAVNEIYSPQADDQFIEVLRTLLPIFAKDSTPKDVVVVGRSKIEVEGWNAHMVDGMEVAARKLPDFFKLFPTSARIPTTEVKESFDNYEYRRSEYVFGNRFICVGKEKEQKGKVTVTYGVSLGVVDQDRSAMQSTKFTTLTSKEQQIVISEVIASLETLRNFFKGYVKRLEMIRKYNQQLNSTIKDVRNTGDRNKAYHLKRVMHFYRSGLLNSRHFMFGYVKSTLGALIDYVEASRRATQDEQMH